MATTTKQPAFICEFNYLVPWVDADHLALTVYRAKRSGDRDKRSTGETYTLPVKSVLAYPQFDECMEALVEENVLGFCGEEPVNYYDRTWKRMEFAGHLPCLRETYPVARDYVMDNSENRAAFLDSRKRAAEEWRQHEEEQNKRSINPTIEDRQ